MESVSESSSNTTCYVLSRVAPTVANLKTMRNMVVVPDGNAAQTVQSGAVVGH